MMKNECINEILLTTVITKHLGPMVAQVEHKVGENHHIQKIPLDLEVLVRGNSLPR